MVLTAVDGVGGGGGEEEEEEEQRDERGRHSATQRRMDSRIKGIFLVHLFTRRGRFKVVSRGRAHGRNREGG